MDKTVIISGAVLDGNTVDILVKDSRISSISPHSGAFVAACREKDRSMEVIDAEGMVALPPFYNTHTHSAMTLLRGYGDDMPLFEWLSTRIWPMEARFTDADYCAGARLAMLEMIKSGTVYFNDMYWKMQLMPHLVEEMGMRATLCPAFIDNMSERDFDEAVELVNSGYENGNVRIGVAPHAIYTVGAKLMKKCVSLARNTDSKIHIHVSETRKEVEDCLKAHGVTPLIYLDTLGVLGPDVILAHGVYLTDEELGMAAERKVVISHCPCSNMKLGSGIFNARKAVSRGCLVTLGTDGCSSNNNLDMREECKFASLLAKVSGDPEALPAEEIFRMATYNGAKAFGIDAGVIEEGRIADLILIRTDTPAMTPCYNTISNWIYSADSSIVDTVMCNGRILMRNRKVEGEADILAEARERADFLNRK